MSGFCRIKFSINHTNLQGFYFSMNLHHLHNLGGGQFWQQQLCGRDNGEQAEDEQGPAAKDRVSPGDEAVCWIRGFSGRPETGDSQRPSHIFMKLFFTKLFAKHSGCDLVCSCISLQCPEQGQTKVYGKSRAFAGN